MPDIALLGRAHRDNEAIGSIIANGMAIAPNFLAILDISL